MNQTRALHAFGERDDVLRADDIRAQPAFQSRIEGHVAGRINDYVDVAGDALRFFVAETEVVFSYVTPHDLYLVTDETVERAAVSLAQRIERGLGKHIVPEARFRFFLRACAHGHIDAANIRKAIKQHAQCDLAEKTGAADQKNLSIAIDFSW